MTRAAGRPAALPTPGYQAPQRLFLDAGQCLVRFFPERGGPPVDYDFVAFPITRELVVWLATAFAGATSPAGRRRTTSSALSAYGLLRRFAHHLASLNRPPAHPAQLRAAHLESFQMARLGTPNLNRELPTLRSVLRFAPEGAGQDFLARLASKGLERNSTPAASYTPAEFDRITTTARFQLRRAAERIFAGRELLARWRAGQIDAEAEPRTWQHGELLDYVERHGDVPRRDTRQQPDHCVRPFGAGRLMADLHLTFSDIGAAGALLLCLTGQNYSTIATATATHHRADGYTGTTATAVVDLVKPRRGRDRAHMPTAFSGSAPGGPGDNPHRQFDLHTPFGVYALLVDLAGPARAHIGTDLLLTFFCSKGVEKARGFRAGLPNAILTSWSRGANLRADALGEDGLPIPLVVDSRRLRMSWLERHQQPVAHTERTLANEYLARNRGNLAEYQKVVADVLEEQLAGARAAHVMPVLTAADVGTARRWSMFRSLRLFTDWLHGRGRTCFGEVSLADLDDYAAHVKATETSHGQREDRLSIVNRVWSYRDLLPEADRLPQTPPWRGERIQDILQQRRAVREENRTPRIHPETMSALLAWSLRFVETFAEDITAAFSEHLVLSERSGRSRGGRDIPPPRRPKGALTDDLRVLLSGYREQGRPLPGIRDKDGTLRVNLSHLGKVLDTGRGALDVPSNRAVFAEMRLPVIEGTPLDAPVTGRLDGRPWHDGAIDYTEAGFLARHLSTACFIVISYLSGMRSGEVLSLERGCVERDHAHSLVLLRGRHWKGVRDAAGDKVPEGEIRADPWVVTEAVATAIAVLERLHTSTWLFPATLFTDGRDGETILRSRVGASRSETRINHDIAEFLAWVETYCTEHGRSDRIPPDPVHPAIYSARLRRTLAWFIVRRPRGLVAAAIQYGHLRVQMTLGYAGNYASGFPDDLAFEDWLARLDTLADAHQRLREGEQVSGPAAETYRHRVQAATRFAGRVLRTKRHATTMLANPDLQIFPGKGMTCVLDPKRAACRLRSEEDSTRRTPDLDDCRPNCVNIARTDRDIEQVLVQIERLRPLVDDPLAPAFRHAREQHELDRLERIATAHDRTGEPHDGH